MSNSINEYGKDSLRKKGWSNLKQGSLLIVDDNSGIRRLLEEVFSAEGYTVFTAATGLEAIIIAQKHLPDLVLTDIKMPGINGFDLRDKLLSINPNIQILLMSAYSDQNELQEKVHFRGINNLLTKPFDLEQLSMLVDSLLNEKVKKTVSGQ
jgi:two-component system, response regulator, stage 0 sporulation protein F